MYESIITPIAKTISTIFLSLALLTGYTAPVQAPATTDNLGANISAVADFTTSLSAGISSSATTMTLVSFTSGSDSLTVGETYGFKLGGREYVIGTASTSNQIINMTRGVSRSTGTSTIAAYQTAWGRGTSVEITDAPILIRTANILGGKQVIENTIRYDSSVTTTTLATNGANLASVQYVNTVAMGSTTVSANETTNGFVELATGTEISSSTSIGGTGARLAIGANLATSTWTSAALAAGKIPVAQPNTGKLDSAWIATSTLLSPNITFASSTNTTITGSLIVTSSSTLAGTTTINIATSSLPRSDFGTFNKDISQTSATVVSYNYAFPTIPRYIRFSGVGVNGGNISTCSGIASSTSFVVAGVSAQFTGSNSENTASCRFRSNWSPSSDDYNTITAVTIGATSTTFTWTKTNSAAGTASIMWEAVQ